MRIDKLPNFLKPRLRLFLSVDIVGSTAFKQSLPRKNKPENTDRPEEPWFSPIMRFYRGFESEFHKQWEENRNITPKEWGLKKTKPELWKALGDELVYTVIITDYRQAFVCMKAWLDTVNSYRKELRRTKKSLNLKSTGWLAGFPVNNAEVILHSDILGKGISEIEDPLFHNMTLLNKHYKSNDQAKKLVRDFIGPSIDVGFRLAAKSTYRKTIISLELALLLSETMNNFKPKTKFDKLEIHYDGKESLKGVLGGQPYPLFWIDSLAGDALTSAEDELTSKSKIPEGRIRTYCLQFISENKEYIHIPFIEPNTDKVFDEIPKYHNIRLKKLNDYWKKELSRDKMVKKTSSEMEKGGKSTPDQSATQKALLAAANKRT